MSQHFHPGFVEYEFGNRETIPPPAVTTLHQVHSATVVVNQGRPARRDCGDALIENQPGLAIGVKTADCVPILLADPVQRVVAAVHAGWRGTAAAIAATAIRRMASEYGSKPEDIQAAIGPSIGACCFEVGPEVARQFGVLAPGRVHLDLRAINAGQLEAAGVDRAHIAISEECTRCLPEKFHSFRRDGEAAGRMISWIRIKPAV